MANYSLDTFIKTPEQDDKKLFIYDNNNNLAYVLEPLDVNFFYKNNKLVIHHLRTRIERQPSRDHEYTELDFDSVSISQAAEQKANNFKNIVLGYTDYYTTNEIDNLLEQKVDLSVLSNYYTSSQTNNLLENYYTSVETDSGFTILQNNINNLITGVTLNGTYLSGNKTIIESGETLYVPEKFELNVVNLDVDGETNIDGNINFMDLENLYISEISLNNKTLLLKRIDDVYLSVDLSSISGTSSISFWENGSGTDSIKIIGRNSSANGIYSYSEGYYTYAIGDYSHAEGVETSAIGEFSHAEGRESYAEGYTSHVEGYNNYSYGDYSHAEGYTTQANGQRSHAEGTNTQANALSSHSEGAYTQANGIVSHAEGSYTQANGNYSHSEGFYNVSQGYASHTEGGLYENIYGNPDRLENFAYGISSHAEGAGTIARGHNSHAEGYDTTAEADFSHAEGYYNTTNGEYSHAEGYSNITNGGASHVEGYSNISNGYASHAEGKNTKANGDFSHTGGKGYDIFNYPIIASGIASFNHSYRELTNVVSGATGNYSVILGGKNNSATGEGSVVIGGSNCVASGVYSHAEGLLTIASGDYSHVEGQQNVSLGWCSHSEGYNTQANGQASHAEGEFTVANGRYSHAEGNSTIGSGDYSHAEGVETEARGQNSHAEGHNSYAYLQGMYAKKSGGNIGTGQYCNVTVQHTTTNDIITELTLNGLPIYAVLPENCVWNFKINVMGVDNIGNVASYDANGIIKNVSGTTTLVNSSVTELHDDFSIIGLSLAANDSNDSLQVLVTGKVATEINWIGFVEWIEINIF